MPDLDFTRLTAAQTGSSVARMDSTTYQAAVALNVRAALEASGRSTLSVAEATGIPRATLLRRIAGHSSFTVVELASIAHLLGIEPTDLMQVSNNHALPVTA